jgi:hypothetical protein
MFIVNPHFLPTRNIPLEQKNQSQPAIASNKLNSLNQGHCEGRPSLGLGTRMGPELVAFNMAAKTPEVTCAVKLLLYFYFVHYGYSCSTRAATLLMQFVLSKTSLA